MVGLTCKSEIQWFTRAGKEKEFEGICLYLIGVFNAEIWLLFKLPLINKSNIYLLNKAAFLVHKQLSQLKLDRK
jgi:hypothetical protein